MSVTKEDMDVKFKCVEMSSLASTYNVNDSDMSQFFDQDKKLAKKIASVKLKFDVEYCEGKRELHRGHRGYPIAHDIGVWAFSADSLCNYRRILLFF